MRNIGSKLRDFIVYVSGLIDLIRDELFWYAIWVYLSRRIKFIPLPSKVPVCQWDPDEIPQADRTCGKQCTTPEYKNGLAQSSMLNGKQWYFCCPVGYTPQINTDPITGEQSAICIKG